MFLRLISLFLLFSPSFTSAGETELPLSSKYSGQYGDFKIYPINDDTVLFYFYRKYGGNSGALLGDVKIKDGVGIFETNKYGGCKWLMKFEQKKLVIETLENKEKCGFGSNVYAHGDHIRYSSDLPVSFPDRQEGMPVYFKDIVEKRYNKSMQPPAHAPTE